MKIILTIILFLSLSLPAVAQKRQNLWQFDDAALAGSFIADEATTRSLFNRCDTCSEKGVIKHTGARIGVKVGIFSAFKLIEWRAPETRTTTRWVKVGIAAVFAFVSYRNAKLK
jgi:hypothetical protein